ncbi:MAG: hypothetical protein J0H83_05680 [Candidatus Melainabacteria bacterium]|nr:hypothetical protein [Candidatus Melainabacteria bacterium]
MKRKKLILLGLIPLGVAGETFYSSLFPSPQTLPANAAPLLLGGTVLKAETAFGSLEIEVLGDLTKRYHWKAVENAIRNKEIIRLKIEKGVYLNYPGNRSPDLTSFFGLKQNLVDVGF